MSQVSTEAFDFIFNRKELIEERIEKMEFRINRANSRLAKALESPINNPAIALRVGRLEGLLFSRQARLAQLEDDLISYEAVLPEDELNINYNPTLDPNSFNIVFQDSPYDDLIDGDDHVQLKLRGSSPNRRGSATVLSLNNPLYTGTKYILDDSVYTETGFDVGRFIDKYDSVEVFVEVNGVEAKTVTIV